MPKLRLSSNQFTSAVDGIKQIGLPGLLLLLLFATWAILSDEAHALIDQGHQSQTSTSSTSNSVASVRSAIEGDWSLSLKGDQRQDEFNQRTMSLLGIEMNLNYRLSPWLQLKLSPIFRGSSGHSQTETDTDANRSHLEIKNAAAQFVITPLDVTISAGILDQGQMHSVLLLSNRSFPAARLSWKPNSVGVFAETAIPTSSSLSTNTKDFEPTPHFSSMGIFADVASAQFVWLGKLSAFEFSNLPTAIATESGLLGNSVQYANSTEASFLYAYRGFEISSEQKWLMTPKLTPGLKFAATRNAGAPNDLNSAYWIEARLEHQWDSKTRITPSFQYFQIQPDAVVALYADDSLNSNRVGYQALLTLEFIKNFFLYVGGGERDVLFTSPTQSRERRYVLGLETSHVPF